MYKHIGDKTLKVDSALLVDEKLMFSNFYNPGMYSIIKNAKGFSFLVNEHFIQLQTDWVNPIQHLVAEKSIENMAWFTPEELPDNKYYIFGKDGCKKLAEKRNIPLLGQIPIVQSICEGGDAGKPSVLNEDSIVGKAFLEMADQVANQVAKRNATLDPTKKVEINPVLHKVTPKN
jgi:hypothetical protein